ncbi:hypothetical protein ADUPG1_002816, partial [Aduncisulcus paluster]
MEMAEDCVYPIILGNETCNELNLLEEPIVPMIEEEDGPDIPGDTELYDPGHLLGENGSMKEKIDPLLRWYEENDDPNEVAKVEPLRIELEQGESPIAQPPRNFPEKKSQFIRNTVADLLEKGIVKWSRSPWASPVMVAPKKGAEGRMCVDFRRVNQVIRHDRFPLPRIADVFVALQNSKHFAVLDLKSGYYQIPIDQSSREITAFITKEGLYEFQRVP